MDLKNKHMGNFGGFDSFDGGLDYRMLWEMYSRAVVEEIWDLGATDNWRNRLLLFPINSYYL